MTAPTGSATATAGAVLEVRGLAKHFTKGDVDLV